MIIKPKTGMWKGMFSHIGMSSTDKKVGKTYSSPSGNIFAHNHEGTFNGSTDIKGTDSVGYTGYSGTVTAVTINLPKDTVSSKCYTGTQAASVTGAAGNVLVHSAFSDAGTIFGTVLIKVSALPASNEGHRILHFEGNNAGTDVSIIDLRNDATHCHFRFLNMSADGVASTVNIAANTWYQIKFKQICGLDPAPATFVIQVRNIINIWGADESAQTNADYHTAFASVDYVEIGSSYLESVQPTITWDWFAMDTADYPLDPDTP